MPCVNLLDVTCFFLDSPCVLLLTPVVTRCLWRFSEPPRRFSRLDSFVVIISTLLTAGIVFQTARTRALQAAHTHTPRTLRLYDFTYLQYIHRRCTDRNPHANFVDRGAALPAPLQCASTTMKAELDSELSGSVSWNSHWTAVDYVINLSCFFFFLLFYS